MLVICDALWTRVWISHLCPAQRIRAEAMFCTVTLVKLDVNMESRTLTEHSRWRQASQSPFTQFWPFDVDIYFATVSPVRYIQSILLSLLFALQRLIVSPASPWEKVRERQPPGSGKVKAALGRHGLSLPKTRTKLVLWVIYVFCWFLISKRANAFLLHVHTMQAVKAPR